MEPTVAFLSEGKLFVKRPSQRVAEIESQFVQRVMEREARDRERSGWREKNGIWDLQAMGMGALPEFLQQQMGPVRQVAVTALTRGEAAGELLYALTMNQLGGLFNYNPQEDEERRLAHGQDLATHDLARHPRRDLLACTVRDETGASHIAVAPCDRRRFQEVTTGDSVDECPQWVDDEGQRLVYQSSGLARTAQGFISAHGPYRVELLDLEAEKLQTLAEEDYYDFLLPRMTSDGTLYFICRPYGARERMPAWRTAMNIALVPVRLGQAIFAYLNIFSQIYSGKPLTPSGGPRREGPQMRQLFLYGRHLDIARAQREAARGRAVGVVPQTWELVRRATDDTEQVITRGVLAYDVAPDGGVVYTNGHVLHHQSADGEPTRLCTHGLIQKVLVMA